MKRATILFQLMNILLLGLVFSSCKKETVQSASVPHEEIATAKGGGNPNDPPVTPLRVTISDAAGNKITSDGGGDYVHGVNNIRAELDHAGNFQFNTRTASRPGASVPLIRYMKFNFNDPLPGSPIIAPPIFGDPNLDIGNRQVTIGSFLVPSIPIQNMTNGSSQCITLAGGSAYSSKTESAPAWMVNFHRPPNEDAATSPTSFAIITRISDTQWTMIPGSCGGISANSDVGALRNGTTLYGYYHMPFTFTFTKL